MQHAQEPKPGVDAFRVSVDCTPIDWVRFRVFSLGGKDRCKLELYLGLGRVSDRDCPLEIFFSAVPLAARLIDRTQEGQEAGIVLSLIIDRLRHPAEGGDRIIIAVQLMLRRDERAPCMLVLRIGHQDLAIEAKSWFETPDGHEEFGILELLIDGQIATVIGKRQSERALSFAISLCVAAQRAVRLDKEA